MQHEEKSEVWRKAMDFAVELYKRTQSFPANEIEGLAAQIRQAATQIPSNIELAAESNYTSEVIHYLSITRHAAREVRYAARRRARLGTSRRDGMLHDARDSWANQKYGRRALQVA